MAEPTELDPPGALAHPSIGGVTARLLFSAAHVASANGLTALLLAANAVITARTLGPSGRGAIVLVSTGATYLMLISSVGIPIAGRVMLGGPDRRLVVSHYFGLGLLLLLVQLVLTAIIVPVLLELSGVSVTFADDVLLSMYGGALIAAYLLVHSLFGLGLNEHAAYMQAGGALAQLVLVSALAFLGIASPWPYIGALLVGTLCQIAMSGVILAKNGFLVRPSFAGVAMLELLRRGIPAIGLTLGQSATLRIDRVLIGLFLSASPVGVYSVAATGTEIVWLVPTALSQILFHKFASRSVDQSSATAARLFSLLISLVTAAGLFGIAPYAIDFLVGAKFADALIPLRILLVGAVFLASYQLDSYALAAHDRITHAGLATMFGFGVVLLADLWLIPRYGLVGAAWASVIAYAVMAATVRVMVRRVWSPND
jgi:O-antigen/teichoic acid export membrane protein